MVRTGWGSGEDVREDGGTEICISRPQSTHPVELVVAADPEVRQVPVGVRGGDEQTTGRPARVKQTPVALTLDLRTEVRDHCQMGVGFTIFTYQRRQFMTNKLGTTSKESE